MILPKIKMMKILAFMALLFMLPAVVYSQANARFPYELTSADTPPGFKIAGPFDKETRDFSISANRGIVTNKKLIANIYDKIDVNTIDKVYVISYVPGEHSEASMQVYIIQYKSAQALEKEQLKLPREKGCRYLKSNNYLFIVWSEEYAFPKQIDAMADHLKKRWSLTDITRR